jgi:guanylate kinase
VIFSLTGPSGIGKTFLISRIIEVFPQIQELPWLTTRNPRPNEKGHRISLSAERFAELVGTGEIILVQDLYRHRYGIRKSDIEHPSGIWVTEFHCDNLVRARQLQPKGLNIGLVTNDLSFLRDRLTQVRQTESAAEIDERVLAATTEIETIRQHRGLFQAVFEVSRETEQTLAAQVVELVARHLSDEVSPS